MFAKSEEYDRSKPKDLVDGETSGKKLNTTASRRCSWPTSRSIGRQADGRHDARSSESFAAVRSHGSAYEPGPPSSCTKKD